MGSGGTRRTWGSGLQLDATGGFTPGTLPLKAPCRVATTGQIAVLAGGAPSTVDGVALAAQDRVLAKDQIGGVENGIYVVSVLGTGANGTWVRASDMNSSSEVFDGVLVEVCEGTLNADTIWRLITNNPITLGVTGLSFINIYDFINAESDNLGNVGTAARRYIFMSAVDYRVYLSAGDAQPGYSLSTTGLSAGPGGAGALDVTLTRLSAGKWGVNGAIDLTGAASLYFESSDGVAAPVAGAATGRLRYNNAGSGNWQVSTQGGAYTNILTAAGFAGYVNGGNAFGADATIGLTDAFNLDVLTSGLARWRFESGGNLRMGGNFDLYPNTDSQGNVGTAAKRFATSVANAHRVYAAAGDANASATLQTTALLLGVGGATALDTRIRRSATKTITSDDGAAGALTWIHTGNMQFDTTGRMFGTAAARPDVFLRGLNTGSRYITASGVTNITASDVVVIFNATAGNQTPTLPDTTVAANIGMHVWINREAADVSANLVTVTPNAGQTIGGAATRALLAPFTLHLFNSGLGAGTDWTVM